MKEGLSVRLVGALGAFAIAVAAGTAAPVAIAGIDDFPDLRVTMMGPTAPVPKGEDATYTATVTNEGGVASHPADELQLNSLAVGSHDSVQNPFRSAQSSVGPCALTGDPKDPDDHLIADCPLGEVEPGASVQVIAIVQVNESMRFTAFAGSREGQSAMLTTLVQSPPEVTGSKKIKVGSLPSSGCPAADFKLKAKAKGAEKISATLRGPLDAGFKPAANYDEKRLSSEKGEKLAVTIPVRTLAPAYYELKLLAKYPNGPKQETFVAFQRCG